MTEAIRNNSLTVREIAEFLHVSVVSEGVEHELDLTVDGVDFIERASASQLAFIGCQKNVSRIAATAAQVIIAPRSVADSLSSYSGKVFLLVDEAETAFLQIAERLVPPRVPAAIGVSDLAVVAATARIGANSNIHPFARIGEDVRIGEGCEIHSGVVIGDGCVIGDNVRIDPNAVIYANSILGSGITINASTVVGAEGFGYRTVNGRHERLPHVGNVIIHDDVEIGACTTIDRAKVGSTVIGTGTRIDNLVMIAHNCQIGKHNILVGQSGLAGSCSTGQYVVCAGQAGIADHVHLGDGAIVGAKAGVHKDLPGGKAYLGSPAGTAAEHAKEVMSLKRLPELRSTVKSLQKQIEQLQQQVAALLGGSECSDETQCSEQQKTAA
ncbi:MAG: UDP-3-O-(3-hydroxymyristoyl)glucosamine N-acyltransferase [Fuerstiella sp.]